MLFFDRPLEFIEAVYQWIAKSVKAIIEYLGKLFSALFNLSAALLELSLFYIPSLILLLIYLFINKSAWWIAGSAFWFILITHLTQ
jgi:ABC-type proline/glycine betaine transport system permease subunit